MDEASGARWRGAGGTFDPALLAQVEDAGLRASEPTQQRWLDGWLLRLSPGKAKRARCINALASGRLALDDRLAAAQAAYREAGLPMIVRITPFTVPPSLDGDLAARGFTTLDDTRVMVLEALERRSGAPPQAPAGYRWDTLAGAGFAQGVGSLRGSSVPQIQGHTERLAASPVPYRGVVLRHAEDSAVVACGQTAQDGEQVGLYDVFTRAECRGRGLAALLCEYLLSCSANNGARIAYLQVEADNAAARSLYRRLGFLDGFGYHYRVAPEVGQI